MGQYYFASSQNFAVLKTVSESMAGRVAIFHLDPFTPLEMAGMGEQKGWLENYLFNPEQFVQSSHPIIPQLLPLDKETVALSRKALYD